MLKIFSLQQNTEWDTIVKSFKEHDVYWLSSYTKAFKVHGDGEPLLFYYEGKDVRGINVVMKRDISEDSHFNNTIPQKTYWDFSTPYGYGGWIIEGKDTEDIDYEYSEYCKSNNIISEFVRFHPVVKNHKKLEKLYDVIPLGETIAMDLQPEECIWENVTSKNRNVIRKAQKNNIEIRHALNRELLDKFKTIYNATMDKDDADDYYYFNDDFYRSICDDLNENAEVFYACMNEKIIAAAIMIYENGRMNYHLSGSVKEFSNLAPSNLLLYEAARWGSEQGFRTFYLGGGVGSEEDNLFKFKKAFYKGDLYRFYIGKKIFIPELYDELLKKRTDIFNDSYFPLYRA